jgi:hypothetical protein
MSTASDAYEYELNLNPFVCLIMGFIACLLYVFGSNEKKLWKRNNTDHLGKWEVLLMVWLTIKSCIFYTLSTVTTAMIFICTVAARRDEALTTFFEAHGLTVILGVQLVLYNVMTISVVLRMFNKS